MKLKRFYSIAGLMLLFCACAAVPLQGQVNVPLKKAPPVIDGKGNDPVWKNIPWQSGFTRIGTRTKAAQQTRFKVYHDNRNIYFLVEAMEKAMSKRVRKEYSYDSPQIWRNDTIEISLMPDRKSLRFMKLIVDSNGTFSDMTATDDNTNTETYVLNSNWESHAKIRTSAGKDRWTVEAAIPFGSLELNSTHNADWKINIGRNRYAGKTELSSWSFMPIPKHMIPKAFRSVVLQKFNPKRFFFDLEKIQTRFERTKDGRFQLIVDMTLHNNSSSFARFRTNIGVNNLETGKKVNAVQEGRIDANTYRRITRRITCPSQGKSICSIRVESCNTQPVLLRSETLVLELQYQPLKLQVIRPFYRNNIYATMPDKTIEVTLDSAELAGSRLTLEFAGVGFKDKKILTAGKPMRFKYDAKKLKHGRYQLTVTGKKDNRTYRAIQKFRVLPYQKGEVWIDKNHVTYVDGKPFFPFGWYGTASREQMYPWVNSVLMLNRYASVEKAKQSIDNSFRGKGMRMIIFPFQELDPRGWVPWKVFKDPDTRKKGLTPKQREMIINFVSKVGKSEGLLGWYMADEPECRDNNPLWYEEARELIAEHDPYHPCIMLNWGIYGIRRYYKGADILLPDCYPQYFADGSTGHPRWCSSDWAKTAASLRPSWQMPLIECWPAKSRDGKHHGIPNDYFDQRSQFFQALIHNCKGFNMYAWHYSQRYSPFIFGPNDIGKTLMLLKDYMLLNSVPEGVSVTVTPSVQQFQAGIKQRSAKDFCVIAVNTDRNGLKASFTLKNRFSGTLYAAGENRSVKVRNGRFTDSFKGRETHIYMTNRTLANAVPAVQETVNKIARHRADRKKKGNLIAIGEMTHQMMQDYGKGKLPPGAARIKVSSEIKRYINLRTGTTFYLVDGLTHPHLADYSWTPVAGDKKPFVEIRLTKKHPLKKVVIYNNKGNLTDCSVVVNGKTYSVKGNKKDKIVIPLKGEMSDFVRINVLKRKSLKAVLITEIEIY